VRSVMLFVRFLCELGMLAAFLNWGGQATDSTALNIVLLIGLPVAAAFVWGVFLAPKRRVTLPFGARAALEMVLFGLAALALLAADLPVVAIIFAAAAVVQRVALGNGDKLEESLS